jgi:hypothetical protein
VNILVILKGGIVPYKSTEMRDLLICRCTIPASHYVNCVSSITHLMS